MDTPMPRTCGTGSEAPELSSVCPFLSQPPPVRSSKATMANFGILKIWSRRGLRDPRFGSPTVGKEERAQRKAQRSLTSHRIENVEEDETLRKTRCDGTRVNTW
ncbi:hypothetical protein F2Q68_00033041 [Brassica cretica]|uniref:Uncharacterized protein n=1 Tax=Brassica cretica TaxID=69181 RepID=A0A8S9G3Y3_BRACR|nr:hypothetical protein F2Q68_00033041 [Brassica cretica]KAF3603691.1 hypothetical protein F2Q69_00038927 [Brassica cretica]